ncbi:unnamed protein product [Dovyalis caffra]|uniref:Uncharacterized protein n=1 Tax=Dovyalis caffra TaxID=77055 RepID=A0AAV1SSG9_9ROSI|nr:unnamed protein product [Dovyalis caffra]
MAAAVVVEKIEKFNSKRESRHTSKTHKQRRVSLLLHKFNSTVSPPARSRSTITNPERQEKKSYTTS